MLVNIEGLIELEDWKDSEVPLKEIENRLIMLIATYFDVQDQENQFPAYLIKLTLTEH